MAVAADTAKMIANERRGIVDAGADMTAPL
jgi:hypothetical protein